VESNLEIHRADKRRNKQAGFSLIEVLVAIGLLGLLGVIAGGFILPLRLTRTSSSEAQSLTLARSYLELTKNRWLNKLAFENQVMPTTSSGSDLKLPNGWTLTAICKEATTNTTCTTTDDFRTLKVTITPPNGTALTLTTQIAKPSYD
jgi:prepilin-type N-terminal cleavage/methylation domain-containing protein